MALTPKQERFVQEYLVDLNATAAAKRAGYNEKTAYSMGQRLLKKVEIQNSIQEAQRSLQDRTEVTQERIIAETAKLAFFDARKLFDKTGDRCPYRNWMTIPSPRWCVWMCRILPAQTGALSDMSGNINWLTSSRP